jgi:uncharacterized protein (TIGR03067 family)
MLAPLLVLVALAPTVPNHSPKKEPPADEKQWQGTWRLERMEIATGEQTARLKFSPDDAPTWAVVGDQLTSKGLLIDFTAAIKLDSSREAKTFTLTIREGPHKDGVVRGHYSLETDRLTIEELSWPKGIGAEEQRSRLTFRRKAD